MDRLNFEPARGFNRAGKQRSCHAQLFGGKRIGHAKFGKRGAQISVFQHRPRSKPLEQAVLHLGGGGLGIGQTQDMLRFDFVQQQTCHTVCQNTGFARPRIGTQPRRSIRPCGINLGAGGIVKRGGHVRSSGVGSVVASHSPNRAS